MSRRGYALVELLAVIAVGSVLLGIACGLLVLLMGVQQSSRESLRQQVTLANLARQFRCDVRGCTRLLPPDARPRVSPAWRFEGPEGTVMQYRLQGSSLIRGSRPWQRGPGARGVPASRNAQVSLELSAPRGPAIVSLSITTPQGKPTRGTTCAVEIDAALGADRTLTGVAAGANGRGPRLAPAATPDRITSRCPHESQTT